MAGALIPYGRQSIDQDDIDAVVEVLESEWLTTGPKVDAFEAALSEFTGAEHAVALANGTASLHAMVQALRLGPGDEVLVPTMSFAATANCALYQGAKPVFCDVDPETLLIDPADAVEKLTDRTRAIIPVDYAGQPAPYDALRDLSEDHDIALLADSCHAIGATYKDQPVGSLAEMSAFSFHPVKNMTTGEGGAVTTDDRELAERMRTFRNHGITSDHRQRAEQGSWFYEMKELGYNYRLSDIHCSLGISQLKRLPGWIEKRTCIADTYGQALAKIDGAAPLITRPGIEHAYHLYIVRIPDHRDDVFEAMREAKIGANVHYIPIHLHPYYQEHLGTRQGDHPSAEQAYEEILTLPMFPGLTNRQIDRVTTTLSQAITGAIS